MESKKDFLSTTDSDSSHHTLEDSPSTKLLQLRKEVNDLKRIAEQLKMQLHTNQHASSNDNENKNSHESDQDRNSSNEEDSLLQIHLELYKFCGMYCMHASSNELVVGFNSSLTKESPRYAVQFLKNEQHVQTGKWVMPMSVNMEQLKSEVLLDTVQSIIPFIKNCKHHIDCHDSRSRQYQELQSFVENLRNINVQQNLGSTCIVIELLNVNDKKNNCYFTVSIYLFYQSKRARPDEIKFEISGNVNYNTKETKELKKSFKVFRTNELKVAFMNILTEDNAQFVWERKEKSDDEFIADESDDMDKDEKKKERRKRVKKRLRKKSEEKKKKNDSNNTLSEEDMPPKRIKKPKSSQVPLRTERAIHINKSTYQITLNKCAFKLRASQSKWEMNKLVQSNFNIKPLSIKLSRLKMCSSTPLRSNPNNRTPFKVLPSLDISNINASSSSD